jgi:hypothetical protein
VPTIITAGGNASSSGDPAGGLGGSGGNITLSGGNGHLFIGGGAGSTTVTSVPPQFRANFNLSLAPPPVTIGDYLPAPPPFNLTSVGTLTPVANVETHLQKLPSQLGFVRGFLTSGGMGGFGAAPVGSGGNGGTISLSSSASGIWSFRDLDIVTGADVESFQFKIFLTDALQHPYFGATGSQGGMGTVTGPSNGGAGGAAGVLTCTFSGVLDPDVASSTVMNPIYGFGAPGSPFAPTPADSVLDPAYTLGNVNQVIGTDGSNLFRIRLDATGKLAGGSGGVPGGSPSTFPGQFGTQGIGGTITGCVY